MRNIPLALDDAGSPYRLVESTDRTETRVPAGDAQDNDYLLDRIIDLGARVTELEKLLEGKLEHAVTREEVFGAFADKVLERNREQRRTPE